MNPIAKVHDRDIDLWYTDSADHTGEDLVIKTDKDHYTPLGILRVHFSIENISTKDQNVKFAFTFPEGRTPALDFKQRDYMRNDGVLPVDLPARTQTNPKTGEVTERLARRVNRTQWVKLDNDNLDVPFVKPLALLKSHEDKRKPVIGKTHSESNEDLIKAGETKIYSASFYVGEHQVGGGQFEFFIEAFGSGGGYGHLDPTAFNATENFESYADEDELNGKTGGTGWSAGWSITANRVKVDTATAYEGTKSALSINAAVDFTRVLTTPQSEASVYAAWVATASGGWYFKPSTGGTDVGYVTPNAVGGKISIYDNNPGSWVDLGAYSDDVWYPVNIEWDDAGQPDLYRARRYASGAWGSYSAWVDTIAAYSTIDRLNFSFTGTTAKLDTICGTDITAGGCAAAATVVPLSTLLLMGVG